MRTVLVPLTVVALLAPTFAFAQAGEIVSIKGKAEFSVTSPKTGWQPAKAPQALAPDTWVQTLKDSKVALILADKSNVALDSNALLQVKMPAPERSLLDFQKGKAKVETKPITRTMGVVTPGGNATIRGTEWVMEVAEDGRTTFTVIEGEIELANEMGSVSVSADEEGLLEKGRAPTKRRIQNARERVQWVSNFTVEPAVYAELAPGGAMASKYARVLDAFKAGDIEGARQVLAAQVGKDDAPATYFLLADIALYRGAPRDAAEWLRKAAERFPAEPRTLGLLARAYLYADDMPQARESAAAARAKFPDALESQLYSGEVARLDGDVRAAGAALRRATVIAPKDWRAWHALGQLYAERSDPRRGRRALDRADELSPRNAVVLGERGMMEANAYDLGTARSRLGTAIEVTPDDFATWAGLGVTRLKSGDLEGALEALRKATLLEPRYARAHVYLAVVYWQQGRTDEAFAELATASVHDPRDPLPFQFASMMQSDLMRPGDAVASAREAMARLRYTKSLDAIANNLRGGANLGTPLAQLGLESWALKNAQDSFDPLWAGSHLFLADRLSGKFTANSELMQGFLSDPLAFGASNRYQALVSGPGQYATAAWRGAKSSNTQLTEPLLNVNGLVADGRLAYFAEAAGLKTWPDDGSTRDRASSVTVALGARPDDSVGFFLYGNRLNPESRQGFAGRSLFDAHQLIDGQANRWDGGFMYRRGPDTQVWFKGGHGYEDSRLVSREVTRVGTFTSFRDSDFTTQPRRGDVGGRGLHRFANGIEASLAIEGARYRSTDFLERDAFARTTNVGTRLLESVRQDIRDNSKSAEAAMRTDATRPLMFELQVDYTRYEKTNDILVRRDFASQLVPLLDNHEVSETSPRAGAVWKPFAPLTVRAAYQRWLRPASIGSLKASSTAGIALDDRFVLPGGKFERLRGQVEWEATPNIMLTAFADKQEIDNLYSSLVGVLNNRPDSTNLERLRNRSFNALASLDRLEGFPNLDQGELTERGFTANLLLGRRVSLFAEGTWATSENTGTVTASRGKQLAFLPKRRLAVGATCFPMRGLYLAAKAVHRTERFGDEGNTRRIEPEWSGALQGYWESRSKAWSVELIVSNIGAKTADESVGVAINYRF